MPNADRHYQSTIHCLQRLRRRAEQALGDRFDLARFHDAILSQGSMPLQVFEQHVDWFIEQERSR